MCYLEDDFSGWEDAQYGYFKSPGSSITRELAKDWTCHAF